MADSTILFGDLKLLIDKSLLEDRRELRDRLAKVLWENRRFRRELAARKVEIDDITKHWIGEL